MDSNRVQDAYVLGEEEALQLTCREAFEDDNVSSPSSPIDSHRTLSIRLCSLQGVQRQPGDRWLWYGAGEFIPPLQVRVLAKKRAVLRIEGWLNWFFWLTTARYDAL